MAFNFVQSKYDIEITITADKLADYSSIEKKTKFALSDKIKEAKKHRIRKWGLCLKKLKLDYDKFETFRNNFKSISSAKKLPNGFTSGLPFLYIFTANNRRVRATVVHQQYVNGKLYMVTAPLWVRRFYGKEKTDRELYDHAIKASIKTDKFIIDIAPQECYKVLHNRKEENIILKLLK